LPFGAGVALARRRTGIEGSVFVILSDGECDEGSVWEAALFGAHHALGNLIALIDRNHLQSLGPTETTLRLEPLATKWRAFGWQVLEVDGHDHDALELALGTCRKTPEIPSVLICDTTKGNGVSFMENSVDWHYRSPNSEEAMHALIEISGDSSAG
jgi:transketolase